MNNVGLGAHQGNVDQGGPGEGGIQSCLQAADGHRGLPSFLAETDFIDLCCPGFSRRWLE